VRSGHVRSRDVRPGRRTGPGGTRPRNVRPGNV
jgi:hypothetical protein